MCICLSVHMSHKHNSSSTDEPILMKLYMVVAYDLRVSMKKVNHSQKYSREIFELTYFNTAGLMVAFCDSQF